ncbi:MAG: YciI family protein [Acidimicrobiia bacterium]
MPQYLLSVFQEEGAERPSAEHAEMIMTRVAAHQEELKAAGAWVFFGALTDASSATVVRAADGEVSMTDGPYAEAKEQIGGFTVIEAADLDEALEWACKGSEACMWPVEVRPVLGAPPA